MEEIKPKITASVPKIITAINILSLLFEIILLFISFMLVAFNDDGTGRDIAMVMCSLALYYPFYTIYAIVKSRKQKSYLWALSPALFFFIYPFFAGIAPAFFSTPIDWMFFIFFGTKFF